MPIPFLAAIPALLSSLGSGAAAGAGALGSGLSSLGGAAMAGGKALPGMLSNFGGTKFGGAALKGLGSSFGSNIGGQLFGADNSDEEALMRSLQAGTPQIQTNSISSGVFQAPAVGRRFN